MKELMQYIGREIVVSLEGLTVKVLILDIRQVFGQVDCLITPVDGEGQIWKRNIKLD